MSEAQKTTSATSVSPSPVEQAKEAPSVEQAENDLVAAEDAYAVSLANKAPHDQHDLATKRVIAARKALIAAVSADAHQEIERLTRIAKSCGEQADLRVKQLIDAKKQITALQAEIERLKMLIADRAETETP